MLYLAAAVSDFYIHPSDMVINIQWNLNLSIVDTILHGTDWSVLIKELH